MAVCRWRARQNPIRPSAQCCTDKSPAKATLSSSRCKGCWIRTTPAIIIDNSEISPHPWTYKTYGTSFKKPFIFSISKCGLINGVLVRNLTNLWNLNKRIRQYRFRFMTHAQFQFFNDRKLNISLCGFLNLTILLAKIPLQKKKLMRSTLTGEKRL